MVLCRIEAPSPGHRSEGQWKWVSSGKRGMTTFCALGEDKRNYSAGLGPGPAAERVPLDYAYCYCWEF